MKVVAMMDQGNMLLLIPGDDYAEAQKADIPVARVLCRKRRWLMRPVSLHGLMKQGSWKAAELPDQELQMLLADLERVDGPGIDEPWVIGPVKRIAEEEPIKIWRFRPRE